MEMSNSFKYFKFNKLRKFKINSDKEKTYKNRAKRSNATCSRRCINVENKNKKNLAKLVNFESLIKFYGSKQRKRLKMCVIVSEIKTKAKYNRND